MTNKHLACIVVILFVAVLVQLTLSMRGRTEKMKADADRSKAKASEISLQVQIEKSQYSSLEQNSASLIQYLKAWEPYFRAVDSAQSAELKISLRIKDSGLVSLSQKYETMSNPGNTSINSMVRAHLTFEDNYARLLNWLGQIESELPTLRTSEIHMTRGSEANDVRMELILDQPLMKK